MIKQQTQTGLFKQNQLASNPRLPDFDSAPARLAATAQNELDIALTDLTRSQRSWQSMPAADRQQLLLSCLESLACATPRWVDAACEIKHIPAGHLSRAEELLSGPVIGMRYLRLMLRNLRSASRGNANSLPSRPKRGADGRWRVAVMPVTRDLFDPLCFVGFRADVWLKAGLDSEGAQLATQPVEHQSTGTSLVLGAGNVTGIVAADVFGRLFQDQQTVLLKLHPLTAPMQPVLESAFAPLIKSGVLRILTGGPELGMRAVQHAQVDHVHITGSTAAHDAIVWGSSGPDRERRHRSNEPLLDKPITSELGNVSPWIVLPGRYSSKQLHAQVAQVAASITNNAGFNCLSTRVLVTWKHWPQREEFLSLLQSILSQLPRRVSYYPGAVERFERFTGKPCSESANSIPRLPWTLLRDVNFRESPHFCREESFVPICAEMPLDAADEFAFVRSATDFVNEELWGTLCATVSVPNEFRSSPRGRTALHDMLTKLRYGTVCINQFAGVSFALLTTPWGGYPSSTLRDPQSGLGWVHNTFGLQSVEKTVLDGPLVAFPNPIWAPGHPTPEQIAWKLFELYRRPSLLHLMQLGHASAMSLIRKPT